MTEALSLTLLAVAAQTLGNLGLSAGLRPPRRYRLLVLALGLLAIHLGSWFLALRLAPLSRLVPVTAFGHVLNALLAASLLKESVSPRRWAGTLLITGGIWLVLT